MAEENFVLITRLEFTNTVEGQVLHKGTKESCVTVDRMVNAVACHDHRKVLDASTMIFQDLSNEFVVGQKYRVYKEKTDEAVASSDAVPMSTASTR